MGSVHCIRGKEHRPQPSFLWALGFPICSPPQQASDPECPPLPPPRAEQACPRVTRHLQHLCGCLLGTTSLPTSAQGRDASFSTNLIEVWKSGDMHVWESRRPFSMKETSELPSPLPIILLPFLTFYDIQKYSRSTMM